MGGGEESIPARAHGRGRGVWAIATSLGQLKFRNTTKTGGTNATRVDGWSQDHQLRQKKERKGDAERKLRGKPARKGRGKRTKEKIRGQA